MSDERIHLDRDTERWLAELWSTPVGRRWLLKAGLGSAAAAVAARAWSAPVAEAASRVRAGASGVRLQFALGAASGVSDLVLVANGEQHPLVAHTGASRRALRAQAGLWAKMDLGALTHFVEGVSLPTGRAIAVRVQGRRGRREVLVALLWHCPEQAVRALARVSHRLKGSVRGVVGSNERLAALGIRASQITSPREVAQLDIIISTYTTSVALTMCHPNVGTVESTASGATNALLLKTPEVSTLGSYIAKMQRGGRDFATLVQATDPDGSPSQIQLGDKTTPFSIAELNRDDHTFVDAHRAALRSGIRTVRDDATLGAVIDKPLAEQDDTVKRQTWIQPQGVVPRPTAYSRALAGGAGLDVKVKNPGDVFGITTVVNGTYENGKVPLKVANDYVRWVYAYVQYLGKGGQAVPATTGGKYPDTDAQGPDTQYSKFLGVLPQVPTILGIPLGPTTNTIDVTLSLPEGAHTARLLFCGLGSDINGGWRDYFPADAYPNRIAPTNEVLAPALVTGILTIGLTTFALAVDINVAATFASIRKVITAGLTDKATWNELFTVAARAVTLTNAELLGTTTASGLAVYDQVSVNGGKANLWTILLALGTAIVKLLFVPRATVKLLGKVGQALLVNIAGEEVLNALPLVGAVVAALEAAGDLATLAEVCAESVICPWVIENEVTLTYKATVTISRDPCAATFPTTARSWRLEPTVDGALVLDPITGKINQGGKVQSDDIVVQVVAPFGGKQIKWTVVLLDGSGTQVATGVSAQFVNDDPANVPSKVNFAIRQLPATIAAATVFKRAATTTYSTADHGYTWSDQVAVTGTGGGEIQEVTGAAVATTLGVAGMVWKQGDRYFLRGVPVAQNGNTIELAAARTEGYARRPFLLLDSFVDVTKCDVNATAGGNHVLLEPDETSDSYEVRKLTLDSHNGKLDWDPGTSLGRFLLPVSAAALHSSGRVVAVHTDSGRVGRIEPLSAPLAVGGTGIENTRLASYTAGPGTQVGLLSSPIAVAITHPGTVVILEAAGPQLSAFDLNGNPVPYFAPSALRSSRRRRSRRRRVGAPSLEFTLPLDPTKTYLDVAVDGASQIYLLYHTGDGSSVQDYHLDVYKPDGTPLDTSSAGVNVPRIAVDYWRSIYAPNYTPLTDLGTSTPHIDPALRVAEPSLSRFDPTTPATARRRPPAPKKGLG
ncbi:MAG: hypothetical protein JOZ98_24470 [Solirubrobacterales bacterium]|nr:hypothetical protein [Solirubrobacterales bacterium]